MQVTIDSAEPLERVLPVINALYGVSLSLSEAPEVAAEATPARPARRSRSSRAAAPKAAAPQASGRRNRRGAVDAGAVREWARSQGHEVSARGRLSAELLEAYRAAN